MLVLKTAIKNIIGAGKRTWLNVTVLSFTFVIMIAYNGTLDGWKEESWTETKMWEAGEGQIWHPEYERYDMFSLQDAHGVPPLSLQPYIQDKSLSPILILQAAIYPQGRFQNILLKGIDIHQEILEIPSSKLQPVEGEIPAIIGNRMAKSADLKVGDHVMLRWRDKQGVFDAKEILIVDIFDTKASPVDAGQVWISLNDIYNMTGMQDEATFLVKSKTNPVNADTDEWKYKDVDFLMADIEALVNGDRVQSYIIYAILLAIALLAVFDTQMLSIFKRQREIGTYIALGMTPKKVTALFTLEGTSYSLLAILFAAFWGTPLLYWYSKTGMKMIDSASDAGLAIGSVIYPVYHFSSIVTSAVIIIALSALISYLPARKIAKQNVVLALKGKIG